MSGVTAAWIPGSGGVRISLPWRKKPAPVRRGAQRIVPAAQRKIDWRGIGIAMLAGGVLLAAGAGVMVLRDPDVLPVEHIELQRNLEHVSAAELRHALAGKVHGNFFTLDVAQVQRALQALPWIESVAVRRVWPDRLRVEVTERAALAYWMPGGLVSTLGVRYVPDAKTYPADLPILGGPAKSEGVVAAAYNNMNQIFTPLGLRVGALTLDERRAWTVRLDNNLELVLGRGAYEDKLRRFVRHYHRTLAPQLESVQRVDLRYPNGFAVQWKPAAHVKPVM